MSRIGEMKEVLRVEDGCVGNVKSGGVEFFEDNFCHPFSVSWSVPCRFCDEDWVVCGINMHHILQRMADEWSDRIKILN